MLEGKKFFTNLLFLFTGISLCLPLLAQSGRTVPSPSPEPSPEALVIPESKREYPPCEAGLGEVVILHTLELTKLADELNKFGNCGYRVEGILRKHSWPEDRAVQSKFSLYFKRDTTKKYEYAWFLAHRPGEAQTLANNLAEKGFYFKKAMSFVEGACSESTQKSDQKDKESGPLGGYLSMGVDTGAIFLFERKDGSVKKNEYRILDGSTASTRAKDNEKKLADYAAKGFRPVGLWWLGFMRYHFIVTEKDDEIKPEGEYIFSDISLGTAKALTRFAKAGYRLVLTGNNFSILNRISREPIEIEYEAVPFYKDLIKRFPPFLEKGIVEVKVGVDFSSCDVTDSEWFFISPTGKSKSGPRTKEYKLLTLEDFANEYAKEKGWVPVKKIRFTDAQLNELQTAFSNKVYETVKEGNEIKNFSIAGWMSILFERRKQL
jgi:hypothetical protein